MVIDEVEVSTPDLRRARFDGMIGRLDRLLSEFLLAVDDAELDEPDWQTLKHHADDLIGVGNAALERLTRVKQRWLQEQAAPAE